MRQPAALGSNRPAGVTWQRRAACRASPHLFDLDLDAPETPDERSARHVAAKAICRGCPVRTECLTDAIENRGCGIRAGQLLDEGHRA